jgi:hypothetical protein
MAAEPVAAAVQKRRVARLFRSLPYGKTQGKNFSGLPSAQKKPRAIIDLATTLDDDRGLGREPAGKPKTLGLPFGITRLLLLY